MENNGGEGGIRTHGTLAGTPVFETGPIDHSGTSPQGVAFDSRARNLTDASGNRNGSAEHAGVPGQRANRPAMAPCLLRQAMKTLRAGSGERRGDAEEATYI